MILQVASWLYGGAVAKLLTQIMVEKLGVNLFPKMGEVLMSADLGVAKSEDLLVFGISLIAATLIYGLNFWAKKINRHTNKLLDFGFLLFSFLFFWQVWFSPTAVVTTLLIACLAEFGYLCLVFWQGGKKVVSQVPWQYAILAGYWAMTTTTLYSTSLLLSLSMFLVVFVIYEVLSFEKAIGKTLDSPIQLLFLTTLFLPLNKNLIWLGVLVLGGSLVWKRLVKKRVEIGLIKDAAVIILLTHNPLFYVGNYDFIEEGIWLGWLQRLSLGQIPYRDFWMYQPPLILNFIHITTKVWGMSIFSMRLGLEILRILGLVLYFYLVRQIIEGKFVRILLFAIVVGVTSILVRNNIEIRLGMGFWALACWYKYVKSKSDYWLVVSGILASLATLTSLEVGASVILSLLVVIVLFERNRVRKLYLWGLGGGLVAIPLGAWMAMRGSLSPAIYQVLSYSRAFSYGYFNSPVPVPPKSSYLQWGLMDEYLSSQTFGWELAKLGLLLGIFWVVKNMIERRVFSEKDKLISALVLFELIIFRGALGRSDWYHLLFALLPALMILTMVVEKTLGTTKTALILGFLLVLFARENGFRSYMGNLLVNFQTHSRVFSKVYKYESDRAKIIVVDDDEEDKVKSLNQLVTYVEKEIKPEDKVFAYPWAPELYFLTDRLNPTKNDIPYSFFSSDYQRLTIAQLERNPDVVIISQPRSFGGIDAYQLTELDQYIRENYTETDHFDVVNILRRN